MYQNDNYQLAELATLDIDADIILISVQNVPMVGKYLPSENFDFSNKCIIDSFDKGAGQCVPVSMCTSCYVYHF